MPYITRNNAGDIVAQFASMQFEGQEYLEDESPELLPSADEIFAETVRHFEAAVQNELDADANAKGYENIHSAAGKAAIPGRFQAECVAYGVRWRDSWDHCYQELAKVKSGERPMPTIEQIIAELPPRVSAS